MKKNVRLCLNSFDSYYLFLKILCCCCVTERKGNEREQLNMRQVEVQQDKHIRVVKCVKNIVVKKETKKHTDAVWNEGGG